MWEALVRRELRPLADDLKATRANPPTTYGRRAAGKASLKSAKPEWSSSSSAVGSYLSTLHLRAAAIERQGL